MPLMLAGVVVFFAAHSIAVVAPNWRVRARLLIGEGAWKGIYALLSAIGLTLMLLGYAHARVAPTLLYAPPAWLHALTWLLMLPVFPLLFAAYLPGTIQRASKHPMLAAVKLWASAHLLSNGTLPDVLLFGSFLLWAIIVRISLKRRASERPPGAPPSPYNDLIAVLLGLALYAATIVWLHALVIGVPLLWPTR
ncbi:MAG: NnrU family protein [Steroidobacteraceae bacterium]